MSDQASEPTMEEILASIRRIISEDEPAAGAAPAEEAPAEPAPTPVEAFSAPPEEDVLDLTEPVHDEAPIARPEPLESLGDLDVYTPRAADPAPEPEPYVAPEPAPRAFAPEPEPEPAPFFGTEAEGLVGGSAASTAASAFGRLSRSLSMPADGQTLEGVVRELLKPLLKDWLDQNLPRIVEAKVAEEVERIARRVG